MNTSTLVGVFVAALLLGGAGWWFYNSNNVGSLAGEQATTTATMPEEHGETGGNAQTGTSVGVTVGTTHTVTYSDDGFSPKDITIKVGDTVAWVNNTSGDMWVASAVHPTHSVYAGTSLREHCGSGPSTTAFDQCEGGKTYTFTFTKEGLHRYHDHINASKTGSITVTQ